MKKTLLCLLLALALATPGLAAQVAGPNGTVYAVPDVPRVEESAGLLAVSEGFTQDGVIYTLSGDTAQVAGYTADIPQVCVLPESVTFGGTDYPVTALADNALYNCSRLTALTLPETVVRLGEKALSGCTGLTSIAIPAGVTDILPDALRNCTGLTAITVAPGNTQYHGDGRSLIDSSGRLIQYALNSGASYTVPDGVTDIGDFSLQGAAKLQSVTLPDSVINIQGLAFSGCEALSQVTFGAGLTYIGNYAFEHCQVKRVDLPATISRVEGNAFGDCPVEAFTVAGDGTGDIYAQDGVLFSRHYTGFGESQGVHALILYPAGSAQTRYTIPNGVECVGNDAFLRAENLQTVTFPNSLTRIDDSGFCGTGLRSVTVPDTVTELGPYAFQVNEKLTRATLGSGVAELPSGLFYGCTALEEVDLPAQITSIGDEAFENCTALQAVHVAADNPSYQDVEGALYSKDGTRLLLCPAGVEAVSIPAAVTTIDPGAFKACAKVSAFAVEPGNGVFSVRDGVLFQTGEDDAIILHTYPAGKKDAAYTVPAGVTRIGERAFNNIPALAKLDTADVTEIGRWAVFKTPALKELALPKVEVLEGSCLWGFRGPGVEFPSTLREMGQQVMDFNDSVEYVTFAGDVPSLGDNDFRNWFMTDGDNFRYVYVPEGKLLAYKDALAKAQLKPGVMIVTGDYVPRDTVEEQIAALGQGSTLAEVNAAAAGVVRMLSAEQKALPTELLAKADQLFQAAHSGLKVMVDQAAVSDTTLTVQGLALASGLVEKQDETGAVSGTVKLTATQKAPQAENERLVLDFALSVDSAAAQPQSPVVVTLDLPQSLRQGTFYLTHRSGESETQVPYDRQGDRVTFRADSFSSYVFKAGEPKLRVNYETGVAGKLFVAGYQNGQMRALRAVEVVPGTDAVELDYDSALSYKAFLLDQRAAPVGTVQVVLP